MLDLLPMSASRLLAEIATALFDSGAVESVCDALGKGGLALSSTPVRHSAIAAGSGSVEARLRDLQKLWSQLPHISSSTFAIALRLAAETLRAERERTAKTEVVWTGPRAETSYLRATRQVVLELVRGARSEVLIVGYWIASNRDHTGIVHQIVEEIASAAHRGAAIKVILDRAARPGGETNRDQFLALWPQGLEPPLLLTWRSSDDDVHLKLHAKVIIADRKDALVTSANFTMHAMELNMEMGVRVLGEPAESIVDHFEQLISNGTLVPYGAAE